MLKVSCSTVHNQRQALGSLPHRAVICLPLPIAPVGKATMQKSFYYIDVRHTLNYTRWHLMPVLSMFHAQTMIPRSLYPLHPAALLVNPEPLVPQSAKYIRWEIIKGKSTAAHRHILYLDVCHKLPLVEVSPQRISLSCIA